MDVSCPLGYCYNLLSHNYPVNLSKPCLFFMFRLSADYSGKLKENIVFALNQPSSTRFYSVFTGLKSSGCFLLNVINILNNLNVLIMTETDIWGGYLTLGTAKLINDDYH